MTIVEQTPANDTEQLLALDRATGHEAFVDDEADLFYGIETERLRLRCGRASDAARLSVMMTPSVSRWVASWPVPFTHAMAVKRIEDSRLAFSEGRALPFVMERRENSSVLGWIAVVRKDPRQRRATLGYWLGGAHHGHGYMREAVPSVVALAFQRLGLDAIEATVQPENTASLTVLRSCGMTCTGERMIFAPARSRNELCLLYEVRNPTLLGS